MKHVKYTHLTTTLVLVLGLTATGCLKTRAELEDTDDKKVMQKQVVEMQRARADHEAQTQEFSSQIRNLNGRVEVLEHKTEVGDKNSGDGDKKYAALEERVKSLEQALLQTEQELANLKRGKFSADESRDKSTFEEAEEFFQQKSWKRAAALYQKFRETSPRDKNGSIATYKIGVCFSELGMPKEARVFLEETIEKYPSTKSAKLAKAKLGELSKKRQ